MLEGEPSLIRDECWGMGGMTLQDTKEHGGEGEKSHHQ